MRLIIPKLKPTHCSVITVCGVLDEVDKALLPKLEKLNASAARYRPPGADMQLLHVFATPHAKGLHLHLDVMTPDYFYRMRRAQVRATKKQIDDLFSLVEGRELTADIVGRFELRTEVVNQRFLTPLKGTSVSEGGMKANVRFLSMEFRFENAPVEYVRTFVLSDSWFGVEVSMPMKLEINADYAVTAFDHVNGFFESFILDRQEDGESPQAQDSPAIQS
jgi:hypothetical protein